MSRFSKATRAVLNPLLALFGLKVVSLRQLEREAEHNRVFAPTVAAGLERLRARGLEVKTLIDVGAAVGGWSTAYIQALGRPEHLLLVEAQPVHDEALRSFVARVPGAHVVRAAAGQEVGETWFEASEPFGGVAAAQRGAEGTWIRVPVTTLDAEVRARSLPGPYLVKLDTHGMEVPILEGARTTLASTVALVVECYNFDVAPTAQRFPEFCRTMEGLGFRCVDAWDLLYRPRDRALWQMDLLFVRADRPEFTAPGADHY